MYCPFLYRDFLCYVRDRGWCFGDEISSEYQVLSRGRERMSVSSLWTEYVDFLLDEEVNDDGTRLDSNEMNPFHRLMSDWIRQSDFRPSECYRHFREFYSDFGIIFNDMVKFRRSLELAKQLSD